MKSCEQYQESISEMIDGQLDAAEEQELLAHIEHCDECREMYQAFQAISTSIVPQEVPDGLHEGIMKRVDIAVHAKKTHHKLMQFRSVFGMAACLIVVVGTIFAVRNTTKGKMKMNSADGGIEYTAESVEAPVSFAAGASFAMKADSEETEDAYEPKVKSEQTAIECDTAEAQSVPLSLKLRIIDKGTDSFIGVVTDEGNQGMFHLGEEITVFQTKDGNPSKATADNQYNNGTSVSKLEDEGKSEVTVTFEEFENDSGPGGRKCIYADSVLDEKP